LLIPYLLQDGEIEMNNIEYYLKRKVSEGFNGYRQILSDFNDALDDNTQ
jgi:hypothetical protein